MDKPRSSNQVVSAALTAERLLEDTLAIPDRVSALFDAIAAEVDRAMKNQDVMAIDYFALSGSGDLHHSALATELAFGRLTGIRTAAVPSMRQALYGIHGLTPRSVVIQMSFSGKTARAVEAASLARLAGAKVWALTNVGASELAKLAELCFVKPDTGGNEAAGYPITMLMLYLIAVKVAELRGNLSAEQASELRRQLASAAGDMRRTLDRCMEPARSLAGHFVDAEHVLFVASGPTYGAAVNGSARILEAVGVNSAAQDIEEWAHLNRWVGETASPCLVIVPDGPGRERAAEILDAMRALGKPAVAVVADSDSDLGNRAAAWLPVHCGLVEEFSPLVYNLPGELFAHLLGVVGNRKPYRDDIAAYHRLGEIRWGGFIRQALPESSVVSAFRLTKAG